MALPEQTGRLNDLNCATTLANNLEGKRVDELEPSEREALQSLTAAKAGTGLKLACPMGECTVRWVLGMDRKNTIHREILIGRPICTLF